MSKSDGLYTVKDDAKLKQWHLRKEFFDKGLQLFLLLNSSRADKEESLKEVAISVAAIDQLVQSVEGDIVEKKDDESKNERKTIKPKTMKSYWLKWTMENHGFSNIRLTNEEVSQFSGAVKEYLQYEDDVYTLLSLKYFFPAKPKPGEKTKPLGKDQMLQNSLFLRECKAVWRQAKEELREQVLALVTGSLERTSKSRDSHSGPGIRREGHLHQSEVNALQSIGIKRLKQWVEDDEDAMAAQTKSNTSKDQEDAKKAHINFVKHKDGLRIRLPEGSDSSVPLALRPKSAPRLSFGGNSVRAVPKTVPKTSVELMIGTGLKYVHAINRGQQGKVGDLERSQKMIADSYRSHEENQMQLQEVGQKAFDEWTMLKENRDIAARSLSLLKPPEIETVLSEMDEMVQVSPHCNLTPRDLKYVVQVGVLLKKVDRSLFSDWYKWANTNSSADRENLRKSISASLSKKPSSELPCAISYFFGIAIWDYLEPTCCDVHSSMNSQVRDTFLRLLKPGLDYKATFRDHAQRKYERMVEKGLIHDSDDRDDVIDSISLSRNEMNKLLTSMGVSMKPVEINTLIDAFDENRDGSVTIKEFLNFLGPMREKNAGALAAIKNRCCYHTTCKVTGMPNAYGISQPTKEQIMKFEEENNDDFGDDGYDREHTRGGKSAKRNSSTSKLGRSMTTMQIIKLSSGDKRIRTELPERKKREDMLRKYNILSHKGGDDDDGREEYGDDFDGEEEKKEQPKNSSSCQFVKLTLADRKRSLKVLTDMTKDAREEVVLKTMLANGTAPSPPKLWLISPASEDLKDDYTATTTLRLRWSPGVPDADLVSFFSLEFAGVVSSQAKTERKYKEIVRDPLDADPDAEFAFTFVVSKLEPSLSYAFRIRAFNGYGPGQFTYKVFSCLPSKPPVPRLICATPTSLTIQYEFNKLFMQRMKELREIFDEIDRNNSGTVTRNELTDVMDEKISNYPHLRVLMTKIAVKEGMDPSQGMTGLFDRIESDDNGDISWEEFQLFFVRAGFTSDASPQSNGLPVTYIIEMCESEIDNTYKECMRSALSQATVTRLEPGKACRFRVYAINVDNQPGAKSDSVVFHTMLETPRPPVLRSKEGGCYPVCPNVEFRDGVFPDKISLKWRERRHGVTSRDKGSIERLLGEWSGTGSDGGGVRIEEVFATYDKQKDGYIDAIEFVPLLKDLGVNPEPARVKECLQLFDTNGDGVISFDEFKKWWQRDEVVYTLKRSDPIRPFLVSAPSVAQLMSTNTKRIGSIAEGSKLDNASTSRNSINQRPKSADRIRPKDNVNSSKSTILNNTSKDSHQEVAMPWVCFRGSETEIDISGLVANSLYHFKLRYMGNRTNSMLSSPLVIMTSTNPCSKPVLITFSSNSCRIKWYSPVAGAHKFCLQMKHVKEDGRGEWVTVFCGQENMYISTTLAGDCTYQFRVFGVNSQGTLGPSSPVLEFRTLPRGTKDNAISLSRNARNARETFAIECTTDMCVGDVILLTERLYAKPVIRELPVHDNTKDTSADAKSVTSSTKDRTTNKEAKKGAISSRLNSGLDAGNSVYSARSNGLGGHVVTGIAPAHGDYIGERIMAVYITKDNFKSVRSMSGNENLAADFFSEHRRVWLEVIWQKSSSEACKRYDLSPGEVVERNVSHISEFEVFRSAWVNESERKSLIQELSGLSQCFLQHPL